MTIGFALLLVTSPIALADHAGREESATYGPGASVLAVCEGNSDFDDLAATAVDSVCFEIQPGETTVTLTVHDDRGTTGLAYRFQGEDVNTFARTCASTVTVEIPAGATLVRAWPSDALGSSIRDDCDRVYLFTGLSGTIDALFK